jgi:outer membrane protein OmpA-like peptidoglycan-associated protein
MKRIFFLSLVFLFIFATFVSCRYRRVEVNVPRIAQKDDVYIDAQPTEAVIFINGVKVGKTPLVTKVWFTEKKEIKITAMPMFKGQFRQDVAMTVPAIPRHVTFFMTNKPEKVYSLEEQNRDNIDMMNRIAKEKTEEVPEVVFEKEFINPPTVFFDIDSVELNNNSKDKLKRFADKLSEIKDFTLKLHGFADETGKKEANKKLSILRAETVQRYLVSTGIDEALIKILGHGEIYTLNRDGVILEASLNRKVEIKVIKNEKDTQE